MNKLKLLTAGLLLVIGAVIGGLAVTSILSSSAMNNVQILMLNNRVDWERRAIQAYSEESPQVGAWGLTNLAEVLRSHEAASDKDETQLIRRALVLTYVRLAIIARRSSDEKAYQEHISKAFALAKQVYKDPPKSEEDLLQSVERLDRAAGGRRNP